jgi:hypothetical protein
MKNLLIALFIAAFGIAHAQSQPFVANSKTFGVPFDLSVTEVKREDRVSTIQVTNFYQRSAPATRWMMCMISALAITRGFDYWTVVYPGPPSDGNMGATGEVIVGFPRSPTEKLSESDPRFASPGALPQVLRVDQGASLCLGYRGGQ